MRSRLSLGLVVSIIAVSLIAAACGGGGETVVPTVTPAFTPGAAAPTQPATQPTTAPSGGSGGASLAAGEAAFVGGICATCHKVDGTAAAGVVGPDLTHIGTVAAERVAGQSAEVYIRQSVEDPAAFVTEGFPPLMPPGLQAVLGADYDAVVAYLLSLK